MVQSYTLSPHTLSNFVEVGWTFCFLITDLVALKLERNIHITKVVIHKLTCCKQEERMSVFCAEVVSSDWCSSGGFIITFLLKLIVRCHSNVPRWCNCRVVWGRSPWCQLQAASFSWPCLEIKWVIDFKFRSFQRDEYFFMNSANI